MGRALEILGQDMSGQIFLDTNEYSVNEREPFVNVTIRRDGDTSRAVKVTYSTNDDTAKAGLDYTAKNGTVTIPVGASSVTVQIPIINDSLAEATERFGFSLINVDSGTLLLPRTANISILDDERPVVEPGNPAQTTPFNVTKVDAVTGLNQPMQIEWLPDNKTALVSEKAGMIKVVDFSTGKVTSTLLDLTAKVNADADRGLLDIALHPDLKNNPYLYAYYVVDPPDVKAWGTPDGRDGEGNRYAHLVRYELDLSGAAPKVKPGSETVILGKAGKSLADISGKGALDYTNPAHSALIASEIDPATGQYKQDYLKVDSRSHAGGALEFGPDGALYVSTGDGTSYNYADPRTKSVQDANSLAGKILRIDPLTGQGLSDNPFATGNLDANASKVWQMGLRNPYAMTFTDDGRIMISETGWYSWEEINSGGKGANFGWPYFEGADNGIINRTPGYQDLPEAAAFYAAVQRGDIVVTPGFRAFSHAAADPGYQMSAIVGGTTVYSGDKYPEIFKNDYFFSDIVDGDIFTVDVNDRTQLQYVTNIGRYHAVSFTQGPDGYVYYTDIADNKIVRLDIKDPDANNLIKNSSFEAANGALADAYTILANGQVGPWQSANNKIEVWNNGFNGVKPSQGQNVVEIDHVNGALSQTVKTTAGKTYDLSFDYTGRPGYVASGRMEVVWNGTVIATITPADTVTKTYKYNVPGTGGNDVLTFRAVAGDTDAAGGLLDKVQLLVSSIPGTNTITGTPGNDYIIDTDANDIIMGGDGMDVFALTGKGDDIVDGQGGGYNQVDLNGKASDYTFTRNADGTITVKSAAYGTDLLKNINGFWFYGENKWYTDEQLAPKIIPPGTKNTITGTAGDDYLFDTDADDTMLGGDGMDVFELLKKGNDIVDGQGGAYNQVNLAGKASDYTFARNADGSMTVSSAATGTDTLKNIQGFWFHGEAKWYGAGQLAAPNPPSGVNVINADPSGGYYVGTDGADRFNGGKGMDVFVGGKGNDVYYGGGGDYNQVDLSGKIADWDFRKNADGSYTGTHAEYGVDTFHDISAVWFGEESAWRPMDDLVG